MNIFFLDNDPAKAAEAMCNKHVVKMILESAQLLCSAHHICGKEKLPEKFYKLTHKNHPCSIWTRSHDHNYTWLALHAIALCDEYTYRYGKIHASESIICWCFNVVPNIRGWHYENNLVYEADIYCASDNLWITPPAQAMPDEYKDEDPVKAYRRYYNEYKRKTITMTWTKREPPEWWNIC